MRQRMLDLVQHLDTPQKSAARALVVTNVVIVCLRELLEGGDFVPLEDVAGTRRCCKLHRDSFDLASVASAVVRRFPDSVNIDMCTTTLCDLK